MDIVVTKEMDATNDAYVVVTGTASHEEDVSMPGVYWVGVRGDTPSDLLEDVALEAFHVANGIIRVLDDFDIVAVDPKGRRFVDQRDDADVRFTVDLQQWTNGCLEVDVEEITTFDPDSLGAAQLSQLAREVATVKPAPGMTSTPS